jgi:MscS family membrane protein
LSPSCLINLRRLAALAYLATVLCAQTPTAPADPRATPRGAVLNYLQACREGDYRRAAAYLDVRRGQNGPDLARDLQRVLDEFWRSDPATLSTSPEGDTTDGLDPNLELIAAVETRNRPVDLLLQRVTRDNVSIWLFSASTVAMVPVLLEAQPTTIAVERYLPAPLLADGPLQTAWWVWIALLLLVGVAFALASVLARLIMLALRPIAKRTTSDLDDRLLESIVNPVRLLLAFGAFQVGLLALPTSVLFRTYMGRLVSAVVYFALAWLVVRIIDVVAVKAVATMSARHRVSASSMVPLARRTAKAAALVLALLATLSSWGYNTTALLAGLGVGGLAIALAAQKTIENLFGGLAVATDRPVLVGDYCRYGDKFGTVEDIGLRSTRIRTQERTVVTIPNGQFASLEIENFARRDKIFFHPILNLRRDTTPEQLRTLIAGLRDILLAHPKIDPDPARVRFIGIGQYSLDVEIFAYMQTTDFDQSLIAREELLLSILDLVERTGTALALPSQLNIVARDRR